MYGSKEDWTLEPRPRQFVLQDYESAVPRWCSGCGDHGVLTAIQRLARDEQLPPEKTVIVSGIGCSSRFPHYMKTYGFHGLHGRPLPVASGVRSRRPDLHIFVVTGDGDCCAIGTAHWIHAIRYNMKMVVMMFDNQIYGLTKMQSSPTTQKGFASNTHPEGSPLIPLNPLTVTLGISNASFVGQSVDWVPGHLYGLLRQAHRHPGLSFIRIIQRCPHYTAEVCAVLQRDPSKVLLLTHPDGVPADESVERMFANRREHDPRDLNAAREIAQLEDVVPIGLLYRRPESERYDHASVAGLEMPEAAKLDAIRAELDRFLV